MPTMDETADRFAVEAATIADQPRVDHQLIAEMVTAGARVLDVGCGDGALLQLLADKRGTDGRGMEVNREKVNACVARGLSVVQGNADVDLNDYPDKAFDYAVLSLTIQATRYPRPVLENLLRIGRHAIVSFPNFGHWQIRTTLFFTGRMPQTRNLPEPWYESPRLTFVFDRRFRGVMQNRECGNRGSGCLQLMGPSSADQSQYRVAKPVWREGRFSHEGQVIKRAYSF